MSNAGYKMLYVGAGIAFTSLYVYSEEIKRQVSQNQQAE
jgi:hypothetical protein